MDIEREYILFQNHVLNKVRETVNDLLPSKSRKLSNVQNVNEDICVFLAYFTYLISMKQ